MASECRGRGCGKRDFVSTRRSFELELGPAVFWGALGSPPFMFTSAVLDFYLDNTTIPTPLTRAHAATTSASIPRDHTAQLHPLYTLIARHVPPPPVSTPLLSLPTLQRPTNTSQRSRHVPQAARHLHRPPVRQMRRQMPRVRLVRAPHHARAHLRRVLLRQLPEQVRCVRRRGHLRRLLLLRVHAPREGPRRVSEDCEPGQQ